MTATTEHLEHAEHAQHAAHDPFDRRVAMTMAIVAAVLACVSMLSHRAHNDTLLFQTQANINHTLASDQWGYFQAKKNRQYLYESADSLVLVTAKDPNNPKANEQAQALDKDWQAKARTYRADADQIEENAKKLEEQSAKMQEASEKAHHQANRFDLGELGVELALVLCSVAVLTKRLPFWYSGIGFGALGLGVALTGFLLN